ncbi:MAG: hypothetical protein SF051_04275 [Elusimicrobiota bacterium]|nr:hypothetical protein [Elusimicrobiota bacterium]
MNLDFLGTRVRLTAEPGPPLDELARDFSAFGDGGCGEPAVSVRLCGEPCPPPPGPWLWGWRGFKTRPDGGARLVRWDDGSWARCDYGRGEVVVHARDPERLRELGYLAALSRAGEALDRRGLHRVHALAVASPAGAALVLLPSGGGKSTLALELLRRGTLRVLSDESPLVDREGRVHPFPLRLALREGADLAGLAPGDLRPFRRRGYGAKTLVEPAALRAESGPSAPVRWLLAGERSDGPPALAPLSRARALAALAGPLVLGAGLAQMAEYMARADASLALVAASRARAALALAAAASAARLRLGSRGPAATAERLERLLGVA